MPGQLSLEVIAAARAALGKWNVPASVTLAQFAQESGWGHAMPAGSNNPFGIKARPGEPFVMAETHEVIKGVRVPANCAFHKYASLADAFDDHGRLLATAEVYAPAIIAWEASRDAAQFVNLMAPHYATDPQYAASLLSIIATNHLTQYDRA